MSFPTEPIEFQEVYPEPEDFQGTVEALSELSRFRIRRAFRPIKEIRVENPGDGNTTYRIDPILDRHILCFANSGLNDNVTILLPDVGNADAVTYTITRADTNIQNRPVHVQVTNTDGARIDADINLSIIFLSSYRQSVSLQSDGTWWYIC